jgi:putative hydrolase of the HAD superfamily
MAVSPAFRPESLRAPEDEVNLQRQTLVFDADDTLWENNILFERVIADFVAWLKHPTLRTEEVRAVFDDIERANTVAHGYGSQVFLRTLGDCFAQLSERPVTTAERQHIESLAIALLEHRVELVPGVSQTLAELGSRHELYLLTKGAPDEQQRKIEVSGLAHHFRDTFIVAEKDLAVYLDLAERLTLDPATTWMIGNSPKSDILPARRAGWNAVFLPNDNIWALEHDELDPTDSSVLQLSRLAQLTDHF